MPEFSHLYDPQGKVLATFPRPTGMEMSAYYGGAISRDMATWNPTSGSADADILADWETVSARTRDLDRNHGIARAGLQTHVDYIVGSELRLQAKVNARALGWTDERARAWNRNTESGWRDFAESHYFDAAETMNFGGMSRAILRTEMVNGGALVLPKWLRRRPTRYNTAFQLLEIDRLSNPFGGADGQRMRGGVEINPETGAPVAHWIKNSHPGDWYSGTDFGWTRVPTRTQWGRWRVLHIFDPERPEQHRGISHLAALLTRFRSLDKYEVSELQAAVIDAMTSGIIETPLSAEDIASIFGTPEKYLAYQQELKAEVVRMEGGKILQLNPGEKFNSFNPGRPNKAFADFIGAILGHIAAGFYLPKILLMKDFSEVNYSSARAAFVDVWKHFLPRRNWLAFSWASRAYQLWLEEAVNKGDVEGQDFYANRPAYCRCNWIGAGMGSIDPVKEEQANTLCLENNSDTLENICARKGLDFEEVLDQRMIEHQMMTKRHLMVPNVGAVMTSTPGGEDTVKKRAA